MAAALPYRLLIGVLATLGAIGTPLAARATYLPHERIPTDSPVYRDLERLATRFHAASSFLSTRPLRRVEALAYLHALAEAHPGVRQDPAWLRAGRFLDPEASGATRPLIAASDEEGTRVEVSPYASFRYADDPRNDPDINRDHRLGAVLAAQLDTSSVFVLDVYEGTASQGGRGTPDFGDFNSLVQGVNFNSWVNEAYVDVPISQVRVLFGRTWLRWGPGTSGTLALSDAAPALDLLGAEVTALRAFRYSQFVSLLDPGPQTYLAGHRLEWRASAGLSVGLSELARFDGTSQVLYYLIPAVPYSFWEKRPKSGGVSPDDSTGEQLQHNNVLWAADASWVIRPGLRLFGEFLLDDISFSSDYKPDMIGYQAGIDWRRAMGGGEASSGTASALGLLLEYSRVHNYVYSARHNHDFESNGFPTGYVLGPDVEALSAQVALEWGADWEFRAGGELRRKGEGNLDDPWLREDGEVDAAVLSGVVERELRVSGSILYAPARWLRLEGSVGAASIEDQDHIPSPSESETPFRLVARTSW